MAHDCLLFMFPSIVDHFMIFPSLTYNLIHFDCLVGYGDCYLSDLSNHSYRGY